MSSRSRTTLLVLAWNTAKVRAGVLWSELHAPSRDLTPESLRGSRGRDLTLGIARGACTAPVGFHRFEPVDECDRSHSGQFNYPTRNFAQLVHQVSLAAGLYLDLSSIEMIPDVKSLRVPSISRAFPADCPHVRLIFTARGERTSTDGCVRSFPHMVRFNQG